MSSNRRTADARRVRWSDLGSGARTFRVAHGAWGVLNLAGLAYVYRSAALGRRDRWSDASVALLMVEGAALFAGRGNCPFGPLQARLGDPVPMFEWILPARAAKAAVPILTVVTLAGIAGLFIRERRADSGVG